MSEVWPPLPAPGERWRVERIRHGYEDVELVRLRKVRLWGKTVEVDEDGQVFCTGCHELVGVQELGRPGNGHPVGIVRPMVGVFLPVSDDDDGDDAA